ncbi:signal transduction histidine kinase [Gloeocapsa sp. PCC 73106]|nr:signal transduction histidine kinase [Gloeocapsa sp. PCC 73106]
MQVQEKLLNLEKRMRETQRLTHVGNWEHYYQNNSLYWSDEIFSILEIAPQQVEASYEAFVDVIHPGDRDLVNETHEKHLEDRKPCSLTYRLLMKDGRTKYVQAECESEYNQDGTLVVSRGTLQDITNQKVAQLERERAEKALRKVVEGTSAVIGEGFFLKLVTHIGEVLDVNYVIIAELVGDELRTLGFWADGTLQPSIISYKVAPTPCEYALRKGEFYCEAMIQKLFPEAQNLVKMQAESYLGIALKDDHGNGIGAICILDRKPFSSEKRAEALPLLQVFAARAAAELHRYTANAEIYRLNQELEARVEQRTQELKEREARYYALMEGANDAILLADCQGNLLEVNRKTEELFGYSREQLTHMHQSQLHPPEQLDLAVTAFEEVVQGRGNYMINAPILRQDGQIILVDISATLINIGSKVIVQGIFRDITQRLEYENALRESQQFLQTVLDTFPQAVFWKNRESVMLGCNQLFAKLLGLNSPLEIVGKTDFDFCLTEAQIQNYLADDQEVISSGVPKLGIEETTTLAAGEQRWLETNKLPLRDLEGNVVGVVGTFQDISDRKQAELALKSTTEQLDKFFSLALELLCIANTDGYFLRVNQQWENVLGYSVAELEGSRFLDYIHPEDIPDTTQAMAELIKGEAVASFVNRYRCQDGSYRWLDWHGTPSGKLVYAAARDITERILAEQENRQQAKRENLIQEFTQRIRQSLDLQTIFDATCQEIREVMKAERVSIFKFYLESGYDNGEFVAESVAPGLPSVVALRVHDHCFGENYASLYAQGHYYSVADIFDDNLSQCYIDILSQFHVRANLVMPILCGEQLWGLLCVHECNHARQWDWGEINCLQQLASQLGIAIVQANLFKQLQQELRERQQIEQEINERNDELARVTRLKDEFLANMSHELRTPLNAILGMTEGLQEQIFGKINAGQNKALQTIERSSSHLLELINDILDVAKIESGQLELDCNPTSIVSLCQSSLAFVKQQAFKKYIQLETKIPPHLPNLLIDERRIRQVLINLLNNAVKFTPTGGYITLEVSVIPKYMRFSVIDTGIGIEPENITKLFQPFVQIDSALNRQYQGTGLGLALVKRIVELHGGQVGVTSEPGRGSCFTIDLLYTPSTADDPQCLSEPELNFRQIAPESSPLILLAEDNEANISTISSYLRAKGYRLVLAKNGQEAVTLAQSNRPDLILMDIQMPLMNGIEAMTQIRSDRNLAQVPIIALTALAMVGDCEAAKAAGADEYFSKPVKLKQLVITMQQLLNPRQDLL